MELQGISDVLINFYLTIVTDSFIYNQFNLEEKKKVCSFLNESARKSLRKAIRLCCDF